MSENSTELQKYEINLESLSDIDWYNLFSMNSVYLPSECGVYDAVIGAASVQGDHYGEYVSSQTIVHSTELSKEFYTQIMEFNNIPIVVAYSIASLDETNQNHEDLLYGSNSVTLIGEKKSGFEYGKDYTFIKNELFLSQNCLYMKGRVFLLLEEASKMIWKKFNVNFQAMRLFAESFFKEDEFSITRKHHIFKCLMKKVFGISEEYNTLFVNDKILFLIPNQENHKDSVKEYVSLFEFIHLWAFLQARQEKIINGINKIKMPLSDCSLIFGEDNKLNLLYFEDGDHLPCYKQVLSYNNVKIKKDKILKIIRFREKIVNNLIEKSRICNEIFRQYFPEDFFIKTRIIKISEEYENKNLEIKREIVYLYMELIKNLSKLKETVLKNQRELNKINIQINDARENLKNKKITRIASNFKNILPLMSVLPARVKTNVFVESNNVIITRPKNATDVNEFELEVSADNDDKEYNLNVLFNAANKIFKELNCEWLIPVGYVGLCHLYGDRKRFGSKEFLETSPVDLWKTIMPNSVNKIKTKGLRDILDSRKASDPLKLNPTQLFITLMHILRGLKFPYIDAKEGKEKWILGLIEAVFIPSTSSFEWKFSTRLEKIITEQSQYMISNHDAMFSYRGKVLHTAPALQLYIESLIRNNLSKGLFGSKDRCLITPFHDGIKIETIAKAIGLFISKDLREKDLVKKIYSSLDACAEFKGGIESWEKQQKNTPDVMETKLVLRVPEAYKLVYESNELEQRKNDLINKTKYPLKYLD